MSNWFVAVGRKTCSLVLMVVGHVCRNKERLQKREFILEKQAEKRYRIHKDFEIFVRERGVLRQESNFR